MALTCIIAYRSIKQMISVVIKSGFLGVKIKGEVVSLLKVNVLQKAFEAILIVSRTESWLLVISVNHVSKGERVLVPDQKKKGK